MVLLKSKLYGFKDKCHVTLLLGTIILTLNAIFLLKLMFSSDNQNIDTSLHHFEAPSQTYHYTLEKYTDVINKDFLHIKADDLKTIKKICNLFDECVAFNSNGWLKTSSSSQTSFQSDLYIKQKSSVKPIPSKSPPPSMVSSEFSEMLALMKIYIYPTTIGLNHNPRRTGGYAVEKKFVDSLHMSPFITQNSNQATFFFIPIRCSSYILDAPSEHLGIIQAKKIIGEILEDIKTKYSHWSFSNGADHFYICAHEIGAGIGDGVLKNSIALVNTADYDDPYFIPHKDISIPSVPAIPNHISLRFLNGDKSSKKEREILAFYAGDVKSGRIRPTIFNRWSRDDAITLIAHDLSHSTYLDYLQRSMYCLVIRGREAWSPRLVEVIFAGCVPVIISNYYHLPLQGTVNWKEFSVIIPESEVFELKTILQSIPLAIYNSMQMKVAAVAHHFKWNSPPKRSDAFYSIMLELWRHRHVIRYRSKFPTSAVE